MIQNPVALAIILAIGFAALFAVPIWIWEHKPKPRLTPKDPYIDDYLMRRVEIFGCDLDWGTRLFPSQGMSLKEVSAMSDFEISYVLADGSGLEVRKEQCDTRPMTGSVKQIWLKDKKFFKTQRITQVVLTVSTSMERQDYALKIRDETKGNQIFIWNDNREEVRNYRYTLKKPTKLNKINAITGAINALSIEVAYPSFRYVRKKELGEIDNDASISLIIDLPPKRLDGQPQVVLRIS